MALLLLLISSIILASANSAEPSPAQKKNVVMFIADDLRPDIAVYYQEGSQYFPNMHTPNIDELASRSFVAKNAYVQQATCSPSRASFLTGRRPDTTKVHSLAVNYREKGGNFSSMPQHFKNEGYFTAGFGKIFHHTFNSRDTDDLSWTHPFYIPPHKPYWQGYKHSWQAATLEEREKRPLPDESVTRVTIETLDMLAANRSQPFFLAVGFLKPHLPFVFPEEILDLYPPENISLPSNPFGPAGLPRYAWSKWHEIRDYHDIKALGLTGEVNNTIPDDKVLELRRAYYASVTFIDQQIGMIMDALEGHDMLNDTVIAVLGDHGFLLGEHGAWCKHSNFDMATRAPLMISVPGVTDHGIESDDLVEFVDLFPTLAEAAGLESINICPQESSEIAVCTEGSSLLPLMTNDSSIQWKDCAFSQYPRQRGFVRNSIMGYSITTKQYRYTEWNGFDPETTTPYWDKNYGIELYNHETDPEENVNVFDDPSYSNVRSRLAGLLRDGWRAALPKRV